MKFFHNAVKQWVIFNSAYIVIKFYNIFLRKLNSLYKAKIIEQTINEKRIFNFMMDKNKMIFIPTMTDKII